MSLHAIDAARIARAAGLPGRVNTILQTCFFALSGVLPRDRAIEQIKAFIAKTYAKRGEEIVRRNELAVDSAPDGSTGSMCRAKPPPHVSFPPSSRPPRPPSSGT